MAFNRPDEILDLVEDIQRLVAVDLPVGVVDNRDDFTTQFRGPKETWDKDSVEKAVAMISEATGKMWDNYKK